jgi:hypothetical protein
LFLLVAQAEDTFTAVAAVRVDLFHQLYRLML